MTRKMPAADITVSAIGLGCMGMSAFYGARDEAEALATLDRAIDLGVTLFDTADMYGPFTNEELLGRAIVGKRDRVIIASKFGIVADQGLRRVNGSPEYVRHAVEASLKRLGTDVIDLYYLHRVDPETPIEATVGAMADLVRQGKIRAIGLSEVSAATLARASKVHPIAAVQSEYSLWTRDPEKEILAACREHGAALVAYSPLGRGFLAGSIRNTQALAADDFRRHNPRFQGAAFDANLGLAELLKEISARIGATPAQVALAWTLAQGDDIIPIPGTKRCRYLEETVASVDIVLEAEALAALETAFPPGVAVGARYLAPQMASLDG